MSDVSMKRYQFSGEAFTLTQVAGDVIEISFEGTTGTVFLDDQDPNNPYGIATPGGSARFPDVERAVDAVCKRLLAPVKRQRALRKFFDGLKEGGD